MTFPKRVYPKQQRTLPALPLGLVKRWDINDSRAQNIHTKMGEMIALDYQPFSVVEDVGFLACSVQS